MNLPLQLLLLARRTGGAGPYMARRPRRRVATENPRWRPRWRETAGGEPAARRCSRPTTPCLTMRRRRCWTATSALSVAPAGVRQRRETTQQQRATEAGGEAPMVVCPLLVEDLDAKLTQPGGAPTLFFYVALAIGPAFAVAALAGLPWSPSLLAAWEARDGPAVRPGSGWWRSTLGRDHPTPSTRYAQNHPQRGRQCAAATAGCWHQAHTVGEREGPARAAHAQRGDSTRDP